MTACGKRLCDWGFTKVTVWGKHPGCLCGPLKKSPPKGGRRRPGSGSEMEEETGRSHTDGFEGEEGPWAKEMIHIYKLEKAETSVLFVLKSW